MVDVIIFNYHRVCWNLLFFTTHRIYILSDIILISSIYIDFILNRRNIMSRVNAQSMLVNFIILLWIICFIFFL